MSALDRAFIRAYHRPTLRTERGIGDLSQSPERSDNYIAQTGTVPLSSATETIAASATVPLSRALSDLAVSAEPVSASIGVLLDEAMQPDPARAVMPRDENKAHPPPQQSVVRRFDPPAAVARTVAIAAPVQLPANRFAGTPLAQNVTTGSAAAANEWSPLLQVDRVVWPAIHNRFQGPAGTAIAQLADALQSIGESNRKIIGLASCGRGEGVTTLLSAAARNLLERGRKVALVDGHWGNPQLARCLGLLPQVGWEESLSGGLPLEEIVIESLADGLAVLPVREPPAGGIPNMAIAAGLATLARKYDLVLVDLGAFENIADEGRDVMARMEAVLLVQNVRVTPPHRLADVRKRLTAGNLPYAGTIQNFVAG